VALGDLDDDGDLDAFVGNGIEAGQPDKVWLNDGQGILSDSGQRLGNSTSWEVALGDLDDDGDLDAFVASSGLSTVWLNDGTGAFRDSGQSLGPADSVAVALGDLDDDGDLDALVGIAGPEGESNQVWLNDGTGLFHDSGRVLGRSASEGVALGDLDDDGDLDAFVANWFGGANVVWLNNGAGILSDSGQSLGNVNSRAVALGDLDGDEDLDAFVGNEGANKVWLNR
jgi:hypothetical protein